jgi:hypothetical protein
VFQYAFQLMRNGGEGRKEKMARKTSKRREWTKEDVRTLKTLARERVKTSVIARKLKRTEGATRQQAFMLGVSFKAGRRKTRK